MDPNITYFKTSFMFSGFLGQFSAISSEPLNLGPDFALVPALEYNIIVLKKVSSYELFENLFEQKK